jgi:acetyl-CoA acetyltransferase
MQSTHNTIGSMVAIALGCHGYNCTYSQDGVSFESALLDAVMQLETGEAGNALVGAHDEITDNVAHLRDAIEPEGYPFSEGSVAMMLVSGGRPDDALCEVADVRILFRPDVALEAIKEYDAEYVMRNDVTFSLFGRCGPASGLAVHAAANMIAAGRYSSVLVVNESGSNAGLVFLKKV